MIDKRDRTNVSEDVPLDIGDEVGPKVAGLRVGASVVGKSVGTGERTGIQPPAFTFEQLCSIRIVSWFGEQRIDN